MSTRLKVFLSIILGALLLLFFSYVNGYPIVYPDTSTYLASGFELETPFDRPITYGLFLRLASLNGISLWLVVFFQGLIVSSLIFELLKIVLKQKDKLFHVFCIIVVFLSLFTSVSWYVSQLICDIFTAITLLSFVLLLVTESRGKKSFLLYSIFLFATATHMSHVTMNVALILLVVLLRQVNFLQLKNLINPKQLLLCLGLTLSTILVMGSSLSKSKHGFFMGALVEHGIAKKYLDDHCGDVDYKFCMYKDSLPDKAWVFLWNEESPFYKMGGWKGSKKEFSEIINHTLTSPEYIILHIKVSLKVTMIQLTQFKIGDGSTAWDNNSLLFNRVNKYFKSEITGFSSSLQNQNKLGFLNWYNKIIYAIVILSILFLSYSLLNFRNLDKKVLLIICIAILGVIVNAWVCATFANAIDRLGSRVVWLIPLVTMCAIINVRNKK